jgi:hypothetical protein
MTGKSPYEIVTYQPEFREQVLELQRHLWSPDARVNSAYLKWKYERSPYRDLSLITLALQGGKVVGMRGIFGAKWEMGTPSRTFMAPTAGDTVIAPEHRKSGLFMRILEAATEGVAARLREARTKCCSEEEGSGYVFNLGANLATQLASLQTGWRSLGNLEQATWGRAAPSQIRSTQVAPAASVGVAASGAEPFRHRIGSRWGGTQREGRFAALDSSAASPTRRNQHLLVERAPRPAAMAELVQRIGGDGRLRHVRDEEFFAWRFQNPLSLYRFLVWVEDRMEGYLILQAPTMRDDPNFHIVDWEAADDRIRGELLGVAIAMGNFPALNVWSVSLPAPVKALLRRTGFRTPPWPGSIGRAYRAASYRPTLLVKSLDRQRPLRDWVLADRSLLDIENWDLRGIYSDSF